MSNDIFDYWPFPYEPRQNQVDALRWLEQSTSRFNILEAPVGAGKSNIGITYSQYLNQRVNNTRGDSYILTPQRILQEQYERSFKNVDNVDVASFYGKTNYQCHTKQGSCEVGSMVKPKCQNCPHALDKAHAKIAPDTVMNYKLALSSFAFTSAFKPRELMILDECHTLEEQLVNFDALRITYARCKKYDVNFHVPETLDEALQWISDRYLPAIRDVLISLDEQCQPLFDKPGTELTRTEINKLREVESLQEHVDEVMQMTVRKPEYVNEHFVLVSDPTMFEFKRLYGAHSMERIVMPMANKFLFMSSTILNHEGFCNDLGIPMDDVSFKSLPSEFDTSHRPVYYMPQMKVNASWQNDERKDERDQLLASVNKLLDMHKDHSGLIHTGNFQIAQWLVKHINASTHNIYHHNPDSGDDRNAVITAFQNDPKPSVLISPSSTEGLDLKDDLGRFAIFVKCAFPYLGDQWIRKRMRMSTRWYQQRTLIDMIQGGGRIVRDATDWGNVYILDSCWSALYQNAQYMVPQWWLDAYKKI